MTRKMAPKGFADDMLDCMKVKGLGISPSLKAMADAPFGRTDIPVVQLAGLWRGVAAAMNDEFLGCSLRPMPVGSFRLLCHCVLNAGTLRRALPRAMDFLHILLGNLSGYLAVEGESACIILRDSEPFPQAFAHRMYWILIHGLSCWLVGRRLPLKQVDFACKIPVREADYDQFFGARVRFEQAESRLILDERYLDLPIRRSETELKAFLREAPSNILVRYRQESDLTTRTAEMLRKIPPEDWPGIDKISPAFGLSPASFRRHLAQEGQSYQAIKDGIRKDMAIELLTGSSFSIAEVAIRIGFSDPGAFYRAMRKWTGRTPRSYHSLNSDSLTPAA